MNKLIFCAGVDGELFDFPPFTDTFLFEQENYFQIEVTFKKFCFLFFSGVHRLFPSIHFVL